jgi:hypothetical protein
MTVINERGLRRNNSLLSVYDGQRCIGHVLARGKTGFEAFDAEERAIGIYATQREAANAIMERGR